jgi:hypothetical protein
LVGSPPVPQGFRRAVLFAIAAPGRISGCSRMNPFYLRCHKRMTRQQVLDLYFLDARHKLIELAAFLDRVERAEGQDDFRLKSFRAALAKLNGKKKQKAKTVLLAFSDPTTKPIAKATSKGACGACHPQISPISADKFAKPFLRKSA